MIPALAVDDLRRPDATTRHRGIPRSEEVVGFAPLYPPRGQEPECRSRAGRLRLRHDFERGRCIFCDGPEAA